MLATNVAHGVGIDMLLHEGNQGNEFHEDRVHGTQNFLTAFRNYFSGLEPTKTRGTNPVNIYAFNRYANLVGNVLGTPGYHNNYEWNVSGSNIETSIYVLGSGGDNLVKSTLFRWANYDTVTQTVRTAAAEVPSALPQYANPVPPTSTLPPSLYLNAKPAWWTASIPWPAVGPDVTGGSGPGGHAYNIPARLCYDSTPKVAGILNFNADNCYHVASVSPPAAPTNVRIIVSGL